MLTAMKNYNSRKYQSQVERELILGGILITVIVGGGLIWLIWGMPALFTAFVCFAIFLALCAGLWLFWLLLERVARG